MNNVRNVWFWLTVGLVVYILLIVYGCALAVARLAGLI